MIAAELIAGAGLALASFGAGYLFCMRRLAQTWRPPHLTRKAAP